MQEVYDFEVKKYKNYFAGGLIHHNTTIEVILAFSTAFGEYPWSKEPIQFPHYKPRKIRIVGQDWRQQIKTVLIPAMQEWWPKNRPVEIKKNGEGIPSFWKDLITGSTIEILSNNQESRLFEGWMGDLVCFEEPPRRDVRVACARGLIDRCGREFYAMTLLSEAWVHREVIKAVDKDGRPDMTVFNVNADIFVNVGYGITKEGVEQFKKTINEAEQEARLHGKPAFLSGLVYPKFDRQLHVKDLKKIPLDWITDIAIDFHPKKQWAVLFTATDGRDIKYCFDEIWENGSWKYIAEEIIRRIRDNHLRVANIIIDPLSKGDTQSDLNEESVFMKMQSYLMGFGYHLMGASKDKDGGIRMVTDLLWTENEMPALYFDRKKCSHTIWELESYMFDKNTGKPVKEDDDMCECLYRTILLDTKYYEPEDYDEDDYKKPEKQSVNSITGY